MLIEELMRQQSKTDKPAHSPPRNEPSIDKFEDNLVAFLNEILDPTCKKSIIEVELPILVAP
jgi:hypothetical protein